jgi:hypothetical protein
LAITAFRDGWKIRVFAGLDPLTGRQKQISRQVNGSYRQAEKKERELLTEVADGRHAGTRAKTLGGWSTGGVSGGRTTASRSRPRRWTTTAG